MTALSACADPAGPNAEPTSLPADVAAHGVDAEQLTMTVYKDASCGCCGGWVTHAEEHGFTITTEHPESLATVWQDHDVALDLQSCHLARNPDGHLFVGHVPARHVVEYLADPPQGGRGLSVPAMPRGDAGDGAGRPVRPLLRHADHPWGAERLREGGQGLRSEDLTRSARRPIPFDAFGFLSFGHYGNGNGREHRRGVATLGVLADGSVRAAALRLCVPCWVAPGNDVYATIVA